MKYTLSNEDIVMACEEAVKELESSGIETRDKIRINMSLEEVLLTYQKALGEDAVFVLDEGGYFGSKKIRLTVPGDRIDPFSVAEYSSDEDDVMRNVMTRMGKMPRWRYRRSANEIVFSAAKKKLQIGRAHV